jgi:hypothetical protein
LDLLEEPPIVLVEGESLLAGREWEEWGRERKAGILFIYFP